jgi:hypothetical protein
MWDKLRPFGAWERRWIAGRLIVLGASVVLAGCAVGIGFGIPLAPGLSLNVGAGPGGPSLGLSTGWGPLGAGVSLNPHGQLVGSAGVGVGAGPVGVGAGRSMMLFDPQAPRGNASPITPDHGTAQAGDPVAP